jgi:hypothetical protein
MKVFRVDDPLSFVHVVVREARASRPVGGMVLSLHAEAASRVLALRVAWLAGASTP